MAVPALLLVLVSAAAVAVAGPAPAPIRFEDDAVGASRAAPPRADLADLADPRQRQQQQHQQQQLGLGTRGGDASQPHRFAVSPHAGDAGAASVPPADGEARLHKKRRKKKKVICGIANLIAGRDAGANQQVQHRSARQAGQAAGAVGGGQGGPGAPGDGRSYGGIGVAGFLLGTLVGSKLGYGLHQQPVHAVGPVGLAPAPVAAVPVHPVTQTQTQVQQVVPVAPVVPVVPVAPAPVHEDYDDVDVEDDGLVDQYSGGGGYSLCDQLQQRPEPGPLDSHFPLLNGILNGQGGHQRPLYRPPPRPPPPPPHYGYYKPHHSLLYSYLKPWTDLLFKRK